eukprot:TRINITY_DN31226_c0_g1_i1.p1 TRINITY_DN31226_c0_g1~~TRINITY_DN31226_c0_g1_i1.p1  ORF type:complete len:144 (+),score=26.26 TRINITY_DN31226_c0_g1_i1:79-510(+)
MEDISERIQTAVEAVVDDIDYNVSRPQQRAAYKCCYECFDETHGRPSRPGLQACLQQCQARGERTEAIVTGELRRFQERLQRCALQCQDRAQAMQGPDSLHDPTLPTNAAIVRQMEACVRSCAEEQVASLPQMAQRIKYEANR